MSKIMRCACCGALTGHFPQWANQDAGYNICHRCYARLAARWYTQDELHWLYGQPGIHYDEPNRTTTP